MSRPALSPSIERYLADTFARIDRMLAHLRFVEPLTCEVTRPLEPLIETIAGHATARVLGAARHGIQRVFGAHTSAQFEHAASTELATHRPDTRPTMILQVPSWTDLASEMRARLRERMRIVAADLRRVFASAERVLCDYDPRVLAHVFHELADDMIVSRLYIDHVLASWRCHVAAVEGRSEARATAILRTSSPHVPSRRHS